MQWLLEVQRIQVQQHINQLEDVKHMKQPSPLLPPMLSYTIFSVNTVKVD